MKNKIKIKSSVIESECSINLFLSFGDRDYILPSVNGLGVDDLPINEYEENQIPEEAVCAVSGYWSCLHTFVYATKEYGQVNVYQGSKTVSEENVEYKKVFSIEVDG